MKKRGYSSFLIKTIMLLLALIVMVIVGSIAWFIDGDAPAKASGLSVSAETPVDFDIAIGFKTSQTDGYVVSPFSKKFDLTNLEVVYDNDTPDDDTDDISEFYDVFYDFSPLDVTGDGVTLVRPKLTNKNSQIDTESVSYSDVDPNQDYISFDMLVRSTQKTTLYLDSGSQAFGKIESEGGSLINDSSALADTGTLVSESFSADAIVGALRVAFTDYPTYSANEQMFSAGTTPDALWVPRSDIRFYQNDSVNPATVSLYSNIASADDAYASYTIKGADGVSMNTYLHHYYKYISTSDGVEGEFCTFDDAITIVELNKDEIPICEVDERIEGDELYYYGKVHVNIWLEGCDSESRRALRGGQFVINFDIKSGDAVEESTEETQTQE